MKREPGVAAATARPLKAPRPSAALLSVGLLKLDAAKLQVSYDGQPLKLGPTEYKILHYLMSHVEHVHSRSKLLGHVWGDHVFIEERTVDVHVKRLRDSLGPEASSMIETVRGVGYRLTTLVEMATAMPQSAVNQKTGVLLAVNSTGSACAT